MILQALARLLRALVGREEPESANTPGHAFDLPDPPMISDYVDLRHYEMTPEEVEEVAEGLSPDIREWVNIKPVESVPPGYKEDECYECGHSWNAHQPMCLEMIDNGIACECRANRPISTRPEMPGYTGEIVPEFPYAENDAIHWYKVPKETMPTDPYLRYEFRKQALEKLFADGPSIKAILQALDTVMWDRSPEATWEALDELDAIADLLSNLEA